MRKQQKIWKDTEKNKSNIAHVETLFNIVKMKLDSMFQSLLLALIGFGFGFVAGIYLGIVADELFDICPFQGGIDCISYLFWFPLAGVLLGPLLVFIARDFIKDRRKKIIDFNYIT